MEEGGLCSAPARMCCSGTFPALTLSLGLLLFRPIALLSFDPFRPFLSLAIPIDSFSLVTFCSITLRR